MRITITAIVLIINIQVLFCQVTFERWYETPGIWESGFSVKQCKDSGFIVSSPFSIGGLAIRLIRTNIYGDTLWTKYYYGGRVSSSIIEDDNDGGYVLTGAIRDSSNLNLNVLLMKTDINGNLLWEKALGWSYNEEGFSIEKTKDGGFIIGGWTETTIGIDIFIIKTDSLGNEQWKRKYGRYATEMNGLTQTKDGGYITVGSKDEYYDGFKNVRVIKTDSAGIIQWLKTFQESLYVNNWNRDDEAWGVEQTNDGGYIVTGYAYRYPMSNQAFLLKLDSNGNKQWDRFYGGGQDDFFKSVHQLQDGGYICSGGTKSYGSGMYDMWLLRTDENGDSLWSKTFGGTQHDLAYSMEFTNDNGYILSGYTRSFGSGFSNTYLVKTDSIGNTFTSQSDTITKQLYINNVNVEMKINTNPFSNNRVKHKIQMDSYYKELFIDNIIGGKTHE